MSPKAVPELQLEAAAAIKAGIVSGRYQPGERLPTYAEMGAVYPYGRTTLQLAIAQLKRQGFIHASERRGLFVSATPPHLRRYGLAIPFAEQRSWFWQCLCHEFPEVVRERGGKTVIFREVESPHAGTGDCQAMLEQAREQLLAGVVFPNNPPAWPDLAQTPQVAISCLDFPRGGRVDLDVDSFAREAVAWMQERGRKRITLLGLGDAPILWSTERALADAGLPVSPAWRLLIGHPQGADAVVQLLMSLPEATRPDGIIVLQDDLIEHVCTGLQACGAAIDVLTHVNWPWPAGTGLPVRRIGFDIRELLRRCLDQIDARRRGDPCPPVELVPAVAEEDVAPPADRTQEISM